MNNDESKVSPAPVAPQDPAPDSQTTPSVPAPAPESVTTEAKSIEAEALQSERMQRAEVAVDQAGESIGRAVAGAGHAVLRFFARAREEAEDMWAESQHLRSTRSFAAGASSPSIATTADLPVAATPGEAAASEAEVTPLDSAPTP